MRRFLKTIKFTIIILICLFIAGGAFIIKGGYDKYSAALLKKPLENAIGELLSEETYTSYDEIPKIYFDALVAVEDRRYYKHHGFDIIGTARALYNDIKAWKLLEGGSTISQQLAKNLYFPMDNSPQRKIAEIFMALKIEKDYNKKQVLEYYVNSIYYGSGYYNIHDASLGYFGKKPSEMNDYECTLLVGIPNAPSVYSLDVNPALAAKRQEKVISCMVELEYITETEAKKIIDSQNKIKVDNISFNKKGELNETYIGAFAKEL